MRLCNPRSDNATAEMGTHVHVHGRTRALAPLGAPVSRCGDRDAVRRVRRHRHRRALGLPCCRGHRYRASHTLYGLFSGLFSGLGPLARIEQNTSGRPSSAPHSRNKFVVGFCEIRVSTFSYSMHTDRTRRTMRQRDRGAEDTCHCMVEDMRHCMVEDTRHCMIEDTWYCMIKDMWCHIVKGHRSRPRDAWVPWVHRRDRLGLVVHQEQSVRACLCAYMRACVRACVYARARCFGDSVFGIPG